MPTVTIDRDVIRITLHGWERVWALKGGVTIPLAHVRSVAIAPRDLRPKGLRAPGSYLPGVITAGTWRWRGVKEFWSVRHKSKALALELSDDNYTRVVVEVDDPTRVAAEIERALSQRSSG
jgi:hypothetical protein